MKWGTSYNQLIVIYDVIQVIGLKTGQISIRLAFQNTWSPIKMQANRFPHWSGKHCNKIYNSLHCVFCPIRKLCVSVLFFISLSPWHLSLTTLPSTHFKCYILRKGSDNALNMVLWWRGKITIQTAGTTVKLKKHKTQRKRWKFT